MNRTLYDPRSDNTDSLDSIDEEVEALSSEVASLITSTSLYYFQVPNSLF